MTTSFNPDIGSLGAFALGRCGVRRPEITTGHLADVAMAANLVQVDWSTSQPNLWQVQLSQVTLVQGEPSYTLPPNLLFLLDCYLTITYEGVSTDRIIYGVSRSQYATYPNKLHEAPPTVYWFDRIVPPVITLYPAPDGNATYVLSYYGAMQDSDTNLPGAATTSLPYRMMSPFADALAAKLALSYAPDKYQMLAMVAERSYRAATATENENVPLFITPGVQGYYH
jgi:hypothetical protein